ncbi:tryptophan--tRNA ligase [Candidatus Parcubacteria bacterium]|nr:MAG: tryptophan--tRNA ligase [Candidatus Parcubacteria bacterium]
MAKKILLTGDRPTGKLHLGHYVGSLANRVKFQKEYDCFFIIADYQVLTDHIQDTKQVPQNVEEVILDWLSIGLDPKQSTFFIQSAVPQLAELTMYFSMLVTIARLRRNPTIKSEAQNVRVDSDKDNITYGFLGYPISQAADILLFQPDIVPVGEDQLPHIEQTREIAEKFNSLFGKVFKLPKAIVSENSRLPGLDGKSKMSKSLNNAIYLSDSADEVKKKVMTAFTDPTRIRATDPGHLQGNVVFTYLDAFHPDSKELDLLKERYQKGAVGDVEVKKLLIEVLNNFLEPIRIKRKEFAKDKKYLHKIITAGCEKARGVGEKTMQEVRRAVHYDYPGLLG